MEKHIVLPTSPLSRRTLLRRGSMGVLATIVGGLLPQQQASAEALREFRQARYIMGTIVEIVVAAPHKHTAERAMAHGFQALRQVEQRMSIYQSTSALSHINRLAADTWVPLEADLLTVIAAALDVARQSDGALDVTVLPLMQLWGFVQHAGRVPTASEIAATLPLVDYRHVQRDPAHSTIHFTRKGMGLDLGGIAKGFAVDNALQALLAQGVSRAIVNAGGDLFAMGAAPSETPWLVDIQHPSIPERTLATMHVHNRSVATSGGYEKFFEQDGKRYCHLIDPRSGYPVQDIASVTVLADTTMQADALSTAAFILGPDKGFALLAQLPNVEGVMVVRRDATPEALDIRVSHGLQGAIALH
jgi:thiamine biosynthesis lipoprotein